MTSEDIPQPDTQPDVEPVPDDPPEPGHTIRASIEARQQRWSDARRTDEADDEDAASETTS
jgi:hypothetical protein